MAVLKWQDPPARSGAGAFYDSDIEALKANPGKWALIKDDWKTGVAPAAFRKNGCEVTVRRNKDGVTFSVYARFPLLRQRTAAATAQAPSPAPTVNAEQAKVRQAIQAGTALTPPPAPPRKQAPAAAAPAAAVTPANDFGMGGFRAAREARGVPAEGKR